jgi:hypothetical protein
MRGAAARGPEARRARLAKVPLATADGKPAEGRDARVVALIARSARLGLAVDGVTSFPAMGFPLGTMRLSKRGALSARATGLRGFRCFIALSLLSCAKRVAGASRLPPGRLSR